MLTPSVTSQHMGVLRATVPISEKLIHLEQSGKPENGLDYSVTLAKRLRNVPNWLQ